MEGFQFHVYFFFVCTLLNLHSSSELGLWEPNKQVFQGQCKIVWLFVVLNKDCKNILKDLKQNFCKLYLFYQILSNVHFIVTPQSNLLHVDFFLNTIHALQENGEYAVLSFFAHGWTSHQQIMQNKVHRARYSLSFQKLERVLKFTVKQLCQCCCLSNVTKPLACWKQACHILK